MPRHAGYFLTLAERAEPELHGAEQMAWLARLEAEHDNLRAVLGWSLVAHQVETALRLAGALGWFWFLRGHLLEGHRWLEQALAAAEAGRSFDQLRTPPSAVLAKALFADGQMTSLLGDHKAAEAQFTAAGAMGREVGAWPVVAIALVGQGVEQLYERSDYAGARASLEEARAIYRRLDIQWGIASTLLLLGEVSYMEGDHERARAHLEEGLALHRELGEQWGMGLCLKDLAHVARAQGQFARGSGPVQREPANMASIRVQAAVH